MTIRTRFAPSPTGFLHIGGLRTALYAYALAKHSGGDFVLRIEDTDQKREVEGASQALQNTLTKFRLVWDEYYVQSQRHETGIYAKFAQKLVADGHAFYCECKPKNAKEKGYSLELRDPCRDKGLTEGAIKLKVPSGEKISYTDFVHRKEIEWETDTVYDATLLKSDGFPTYHLAVAVDDLDMKISHILRGHDWLPSTPIHLLVFKYLGGSTPEIGHLTDILSAETGKKLSKRRDSVFVEQFLEEGYLPEALLNFVMLLGWAPKDNRELFTLEEFVKAFDVNGFQIANPKFLRDKLDWFNKQYIKKESKEEFVSLVSNASAYSGQVNFIENALGTASIIQPRIGTVAEYDMMIKPLYEEPDPKKVKALLGANYKKHISSAYSALENIKHWKVEEINNVLQNALNEGGYNTGDFYSDIRIAITERKVTPPINEFMESIGSKKVLNRLKILLD